jgi:hypothetical protein
MDCGKVYVTDPKGRKYGPFKPSGNKEWGEIEMPVDNFGYWHLDFADTWMRPLLNLYKVEAAISDSSGKHPLKLFAL